MRFGGMIMLTHEQTIRCAKMCQVLFSHCDPLCEHPLSLSLNSAANTGHNSLPLESLELSWCDKCDSIAVAASARQVQSAPL